MIIFLRPVRLLSPLCGTFNRRDFVYEKMD